ncbi:hypothetical protein [Anaeromicropila herbilytica]|uniref:DUF11 domain-containing protein n=1 Tax=Anaeromicropila herbilytica TaxID=2785025 RepID=A0A7R7EKA9_9FIRM|nr:hypothetical protein [Anaeromicropila herbilytica]BCN30327.1 hypothetical protein bsdtb5_16220 [Anaeromicropila herbilytica]
MAELLNSQANILYNNNTTSGITATDDVLSTNSTSSTMTVQKTVSRGYFKPFDRLTYKIVITNTTNQTLTFTSISDNFTPTGGTYANSPFTYVTGSGSVIINDDPATAPTITQDANGDLAITLGSTLAPYSTAVLTYMMDIGSSFTATNLSNTITVATATESLTSGPLISYKEYALLSASKKAPAIIPSGTAFSYTITLTNTGNTATSSLTISDTLTNVASIDSITTKIDNGTTQTLPSTGGYYTYTAGTGALSILKNYDGSAQIEYIIPATSGVLLVTINGTAS